MITIVPPVKPFRGFREADALGSGVFGASRDGGDRRHLGRDFLASVLDQVIAPITGRVTRVGWAYTDADLGSLTITGDGVEVKLLYLDRATGIKIGSFVEAGDVIGTAQDVSGYYARKSKPGMRNHIHLELAVKVDPSLYLPTPLEVVTA